MCNVSKVFSANTFPFWQEELISIFKGISECNLFINARGFKPLKEISACTENTTSRLLETKRKRCGEEIIKGVRKVGSLRFNPFFFLRYTNDRRLSFPFLPDGPYVRQREEDVMQEEKLARLHTLLSFLISNDYH